MEKFHFNRSLSVFISLYYYFKMVYLYCKRSRNGDVILQSIRFIWNCISVYCAQVWIKAIVETETKDLMEMAVFNNNSTMRNSKLAVDYIRLWTHCIFARIEITWDVIHNGSDLYLRYNSNVITVKWLQIPTFDSISKISCNPPIPLSLDILSYTELLK